MYGVQARSQLSDNGGGEGLFSSDFGLFSGFELRHYFVFKAGIYVASLLDFINSISQTDDIQDVSARTVRGKVDLLVSGVGRQLRPGAPPPSWLCAWSKKIRQ